MRRAKWKSLNVLVERGLLIYRNQVGRNLVSFWTALDGCEPHLGRRLIGDCFGIDLLAFQKRLLSVYIYFAKERKIFLFQELQLLYIHWN